jgi:hypothetical protein
MLKLVPHSNGKPGVFEQVWMLDPIPSDAEIVREAQPCLTWPDGVIVGFERDEDLRRLTAEQLIEIYRIGWAEKQLSQCRADDVHTYPKLG